MTKMTNGYEKRKHSRLKTYDYTNSGCYFITFCTKDRAHVLSSIVGRGALTPPLVELTDIGKIAAEVIERTSVVYPGISIDNYVIMPNHVHLLIRISPVDGGVRAEGELPIGKRSHSGVPRPTENGSVSITEVIKAMKSITTRKIGTKIWQTSFYDHVIRNDEDYQTRFRYIEENPAKWQQDKYYYQEV